MNEGRSSPLIKSKTALIFPNGDVYNPRQGKFCVDALKKEYGFRYLNNLIDFDGKHIPLHYVVADLYLPKVKDKPFLDFKDGDRKNCNVDNLFWTETDITISPPESLEGEIWKPIPGFNDKYSVSNLGRVFSRRKVLIMKQKYDHDGYLSMNLGYKDIQKYPLVHRLVAEAFIPNPENLPTVNHKDEVKDNNTVDNLEWASYQYNNTYGTRIEKAFSDVRRTIQSNWKQVICLNDNKVYANINECARAYKCKPYSVERICNNLFTEYNELQFEFYNLNKHGILPIEGYDSDGKQTIK